jgi:hypothetical protein
MLLLTAIIKSRSLFEDIHTPFDTAKKELIIAYK